MKKIFAMAAAALLSIAAFAQEGRAIYNTYSGKPGVQSVYISPAMFRLVGNLPELRISDDNLDIATLVKSLKGFYLINMENGSSASKAQLKKDVAAAVAKGKYELMMEAKEEGSTMSIYTISHNGLIESFIMIADDGGDTAFICLDGEIPEEELNKLLAAAMQ